MTQAATAASPTSQRRLAHKRVLSPPSPGFLGNGHTAVEVIDGADLTATDPFVLLMDDRIDFAAGRKLGEAHPHAGLETVTLALEGEVIDEDEGPLRAGDLVWMTAGRGVVHSEHMRATGQRTRVLQLWITLPERQRSAPPRFQVLRAADVPVFRGPGVTARLYSGTTHGLRAPTENYVPVTLVDLQLDAGATFAQELPASYGGFLYPISGRVRVDADQTLDVGELGWLDRPLASENTELKLTGGPNGGRVVLYAGERQNEPTVHRGPFVAGSASDLNRMYQEYRAGRFTLLSQLAPVVGS